MRDDPYTSTSMKPAGADSDADGVGTRILEALEAERARLAREIHDGPAQGLSNAIFEVEYIEKVIDADPGLARAELKVLRDRLGRQLEDVRAFMTQLRPPAVDEAGLSDAIGAAVRQLESSPGLSASIDLAAGTESLTDGQRIVVLRIAQEALQNVRKHAKAAKVTVVTRSGDAAWVLEVRDDGHGFDSAAGAARGGRNFGLQFMRERAELIGAQLDVRSGPNGGTVVRLSIPNEPAMGAEESR